MSIRNLSAAWWNAPANLKVGDGLDPAVEMGPVINEQQLQTVMTYVEIGKKEGASCCAGGHRLEQGGYARGWFHAPTIFADCDPKMRICPGRNFRPGRLGHPDAAAWRRASRSRTGYAYGLSASLYTRNVNAAFAAMRDLYTASST